MQRAPAPRGPIWGVLEGMDVRILGPLEVDVDGAPCTISGGAERALLARLAISAGAVVSSDVLVDDLWGVRLPVDAANALQTRVSKLRRSLPAGAAAAIVTQRPGYLLRVPPSAVDANRFTALVGQARRARQRTALAAAATAYDEALRLWRGPALTEFGAVWATGEAARLEELRLVAIEERNDVALALGRHGELVAELEALAAEHPLRERYRAQLMLALYRSGRQADALAVYAHARATLGGELGIDPGEELQQLEAAVLRQDPSLASPVRQAETPRMALPRRRSSFLGREAQLADIAELLGRHHLVTLTGPGGAGKTTLAVEAARGLADRFPDGGAFVALSGIADPARLPGAVAEAMDITVAETAGAVTDRLVAALASRQALVVLDNCEHLAGAAADLAERLLGACPDLRVLATSREPLGVDGEVQLPVPPLPLPQAGAGLEAAAATEAVRLFVDRAAAVDPGFALDEGNVDAVGRICTGLDGMPLAIELAAARVKILPAAEIAARLGDRFALLTHGRRTAEARQRTLRATVDWSHDLLGDDERRLYRRLSVFRGGWTLDAAEEVCSGDGLDPRDVVELLARLVDRSLVVPEAARGRFRMLETLREYGQERLAEAGELEALRERHLRFFLDLAERAEIRLRGHQQGSWLQRLRAERDNLHQALGWCAEEPQHRAEVGLRLAGALGWWWYLGRHHEGRSWIDRMLAAAGPASAAASARAHRAASLVWRPGACVVHPDPRCAEEARAALRAAQAAGDAALAAYARTLLAAEAVGPGDASAAAALLAQATATFQEHEDGWGLALVAFVRSEIAFQRASVPFDEALRQSDQAARAFEELGDEWGLSAVLAHQTHALERNGQHERALASSVRVVEIARRLGLKVTLQWMLAEVGYLHLLSGRAAQAEPLAAEALELAQAMGGGPGIPASHLVRGVAARLRGAQAAAHAHFAEAAAQARAQGITHMLVSALVGAGHVAMAQGDLAAAQRHHEHALAEARAGGEAAGTALALEGLAEVAAARRDARTAALLLGCAGETRRRYGRPANPLQRRDVERATAATRALLPAADLEAALAEGRRTAPEQLAPTTPAPSAAVP